MIDSESSDSLLEGERFYVAMAAEALLDWEV